VQGLWEEANRKASETFIAIANDEPIATEALGKAQSAAGGTSLDLTSIKAAITEKLGVKLPESGLGSDEAAQAAVQAGDAQAGLEVIAPDQISTIRDIATVIQKPISQTALTAGSATASSSSRAPRSPGRPGLPRGCGSSSLRACGTRCGRPSERCRCFWC
jgi:acyl carrier protein